MDGSKLKQTARKSTGEVAPRVAPKVAPRVWEAERTMVWMTLRWPSAWDCW